MGGAHHFGLLKARPITEKFGSLMWDGRSLEQLDSHLKFRHSSICYNSVILI